MKEEWKRVNLNGFKFDYWISNKARVKNKKGKILKPYKRGQRKGTYYCVALYRNKRRTVIDLQRLVGFHFVPNPYNKPEVNHIDCNPFNNWSNNLEWCTRSENERHKRFMIAHREFV